MEIEIEKRMISIRIDLDNQSNARTNNDYTYNKQDILNWKNDQNGNFTFKFTYEILNRSNTKKKQVFCYDLKS